MGVLAMENVRSITQQQPGTQSFVGASAGPFNCSFLPVLRFLWPVAISSCPVIGNCARSVLPSR